MKHNYQEIVSLINAPAPGKVNKASMSNDAWHNLLHFAQDEALKFLKKYFGKDWECSTFLRNVWNVYVDRLADMKDCPYTLLMRFKDLVLPHIESSPEAIVKQLERVLKPGKSVGYGFYGINKMSDFKNATFDVRQVCLETVRSFLNSIFDVWEERESLKLTYERFAKRLNTLKLDEDPFVLTQRFLYVLRQVDVLDSRLSGSESLRAIRRKANVEETRGDPQVGTNKSPRKHKNGDDWENDMPVYLQPVEKKGCDYYFPRTLTDDHLENVLSRDKLVFDLDGLDDDGNPLVRLTTPDEQSWAIYRTETSGYIRINVNRPFHSGPIHVKNQQAA